MPEHEWSLALPFTGWLLWLKVYRGHGTAYAPQCDGWWRFGWGEFIVGGFGVFFDAHPAEAVLTVECRPKDEEGA